MQWALLISATAFLALGLSDLVNFHPTPQAAAAVRNMLWGKYRLHYWTGLFLGGVVPLVPHRDGSGRLPRLDLRCGVCVGSHRPVRLRARLHTGRAIGPPKLVNSEYLYRAKAMNEMKMDKGQAGEHPDIGGREPGAHRGLRAAPKAEDWDDWMGVRSQGMAAGKWSGDTAWFPPRASTASQPAGLSPT